MRRMNQALDMFKLKTKMSSQIFAWNISDDYSLEYGYFVTLCW